LGSSLCFRFIFFLSEFDGNLTIRPRFQHVHVVSMYAVLLVYLIQVAHISAVYVLFHIQLLSSSTVSVNRLFSFPINIFMKKLIPILILAGCSHSLTLHRVIPPLEPVDTAAAMVGLDERSSRDQLHSFIGIDPVSYQWCAAFVNSILKLHGIPGSESVSDYPLSARSFLKWGVPVSEPQIGDIVVFERNGNGWEGHVGFYVETAVVEGVPSYVVLGGNQNNEISYDSYPISRVLGIRRIP